MGNLDLHNYRYTVLPFFEASKKYPYRDDKGFITAGRGKKMDIEFTKDYTGSEEDLKALNDVLKSGTVYIQEDIKKVVLEKSLTRLFPDPIDKEKNIYKEDAYGGTAEHPYKEHNKNNLSPFYDYLLDRGAELYYNGKMEISFLKATDKGIPDASVDGYDQKLTEVKNWNYDYFFQWGDRYRFDRHELLFNKKEKKLGIFLSNRMIELPLLDIKIGHMGLSEQQLCGLLDLGYQGGFKVGTEDWGGSDRDPHALKATVFVFLYINYLTKMQGSSPISFKELHGGETLENVIKEVVFITNILHHTRTVGRLPYEKKKLWYQSVNAITDSLTHYMNLKSGEASTEMKTLRNMFRLHAIFGVQKTFTFGNNTIQIVTG